MNIKKKILFIIVFALAIPTIVAQGELHFTNHKTKQKIKFEYINNLIIIPIEVNDSKLNFILDTGASNTVIFTLEDIVAPKFENTKKIMLRGLGSGEPLEAILSQKNKVKIGHVEGLDHNIYLLFIKEFDVSSKVGKTVHGIIGNDFFKNFVVTIDFKFQTLTITKRTHFKKPRSKKFTPFNLDFHNNKPYIDGQLFIKKGDNQKVKILIDTGNSDALWIFEDPNHNIFTPTPFFEDHLGEGISGSIYGKRSIIEQFSIGNFDIKKPTAAFLDTTETVYARSYEHRNGSLGNKILSRFKIILDYQANEIWLKKTKKFSNEFKFNRSGIGLSYAGNVLVKTKHLKPNAYKTLESSIDDNIIQFEYVYEYDFKPIYVIENLRVNSPAEKTGLKVNDILVQINKKDAYNYTRDEINEILYGKPGTKITLQVMRGTQKLTFSFLLEELWNQ